MFLFYSTVYLLELISHKAPNKSSLICKGFLLCFAAPKEINSKELKTFYIWPTNTMARKDWEICKVLKTVGEQFCGPFSNNLHLQVLQDIISFTLKKSGCPETSVYWQSIQCISLTNICPPVFEIYPRTSSSQDLDLFISSAEKFLIFADLLYFYLNVTLHLKH